MNTKMDAGSGCCAPRSAAKDFPKWTKVLIAASIITAPALAGAQSIPGFGPPPRIYIPHNFSGTNAPKRAPEAPKPPKPKPEVAKPDVKPPEVAKPVVTTPTTVMTPAPVAPATTPRPKPAALDDVKAENHDVWVAGDGAYLFGDVLVTLGRSLAESLGGTAPEIQSVIAPRQSYYYGGSLSYSYGAKRNLYFDLNYAQGHSDAKAKDLDGGSMGKFDTTDFTVDDSWIQGYLRYSFSELTVGKPYTIYARLGVSYVKTELEMRADIPKLGLYNQSSESTDIMGNIGLGVSYAFLRKEHHRLGALVEMDVFGGQRTQDMTEKLYYQTSGTPVSKDDLVYGGLGRLTLRYEYVTGKTYSWRYFVDFGGQARALWVNDPDGKESMEMLYGVYGRLGVKYSF
jgi:hypothetical protein